MNQIDVEQIPDAAKVAAWVALLAGLAKGFHASWRWVMKRLITPLFSEAVREAIQPQLEAMQRESASWRERTQLEWEAVVEMQREDHKMIRAIHQKLTGKLPDFPPRAD